MPTAAGNISASCANAAAKSPKRAAIPGATAVAAVVTGMAIMIAETGAIAAATAGKILPAGRTLRPAFSRQARPRNPLQVDSGPA